MSNIQMHNELTSEERVITLYEICKVLSKEHNKAVKVVKELHDLEGFGWVEEIASQYESGKGRVSEIKTFSYTKKQALMVGARLDSRNIIKLVNKLEELSAPRPMTTVEQIALIAQGHLEMNSRVAVVEEKLEDVLANRKIENWQQKALTDAKNKKVYQIAERGNLIDDKAAVSKLHRKVWSLFKKQFHLPRYNELPGSHYESGLEFIENLTLADMM